MKKIFLSGGGDSKDSKDLDSKFVDSLPNEKFVYIPIAMEGNKKHSYDQCYKWISKTFSPLMGKNARITMLTDLSSVKISYLKSFDAVYLGGGNTYRLLRSIKISNFDATLKKFIQNDGHVYGGSAGGIILGKDISTVREENIIQYKDSSGLDLVKGLSVKCHYKQTERETRKIREFINRYRSGVLALPEQTGLIISSGDEIEVVGSKPAYLFSITEIPFKKVKGNFIYKKLLD